MMLIACDYCLCPLKYEGLYKDSSVFLVAYDCISCHEQEFLNVELCDSIHTELIPKKRRK